MDAGRFRSGDITKKVGRHVLVLISASWHSQYRAIDTVLLFGVLFVP